MIRALPERPNLQQYKKQAKELLRAFRSGEADAETRVRTHLPRLVRAAGHEVASARLRLSDAQWVIAREHGFASWPRFKHQVKGLERGELRPLGPGWIAAHDRAGRVLSVLRAGRDDATRLARDHHPKFRRAPSSEIETADFTLDDALLIVARQHGFERWEELRTHFEAFETQDPTDPHSAARLAILSSDLPALDALLRAHPEIVHTRGKNGARLLHLAAGAGEVEIVERLLAFGSDVEAADDRGLTALHQAAYGSPPEPCPGQQRASAQIISILLAAGARPDRIGRCDGETPLMLALWWGHVRLAEQLARRGVFPLNLRSAAGLGLLNLLRRLLDPSGELAPEAREGRAFYRPHSGFPEWTPSDDSQEILDEALGYACANGRSEAIDFLLERGADPNGQPYMCSALHRLARTGYLDAARRLLERGADPNLRGRWGGQVGITPLHLAVWSGCFDMVRLLVESGAALDARDETHGGTPASWAAVFEYDGLRDWLRAQEAAR